MRAFACSVCRRLVPFEATRCLHCGAALAFDPERREIVGRRDAERRWPCANAMLIGCNWLAPAEGALCRACVLTGTRPADDDAEGIERLAGAERAKRRLLFDLLELGVPVPRERREGELSFALLSSAAAPVTTGHADGLVTMDLAEEDDAHRERLRLQLDEPYRTVLGHLRHEVGHHLWTVLVLRSGDDAALAEARALFGDERADYGAALDRHYAEGPPADWADRHVSAYATMHPAEDWAETTAHYLHVWDALQTAASFRVSVAGPEQVADPAGTAAGRIAPPVPGRFAEALEQWLPLSYALNALNRSLGHGDLYPFVLAPAVLDKLRFVDRMVAGAAA